MSAPIDRRRKIREWVPHPLPGRLAPGWRKISVLMAFDGAPGVHHGVLCGKRDWETESKADLFAAERNLFDPKLRPLSLLLRDKLEKFFEKV